MVIQSDKEPSLLDSRVENFVQGIEVGLLYKTRPTKFSISQ